MANAVQYVSRQREITKPLSEIRLLTMTDKSTLRDELSGHHLIHRLRNWEDGDDLYGAMFIGDKVTSGKTFRPAEEPAEERAREHYNTDLFNGPDTTAILYKATVRNPHAEAHDPNDPGEPALVHGDLENVEILDHDPADP